MSRARRDWVSPLASSSSASTSPGGIATSGQARSVAIVLTHFLDANDRPRVVFESHDEPLTVAEADRVLAPALALEGMHVQRLQIEKIPAIPGGPQRVDALDV